MKSNSPPEALSARSNFGLISKKFQELHALAFSRSAPVDLTQSNPGRVGLQLPDFLELLRKGGENVYMPCPRGLLGAREAVAATLQSRGAVSAADILLTASTSEAYSYLLQVLCDPGDAILVPEPSYPLFHQLAQLCGVRLVPYQLVYDGAWHIDLASLPSTQEIHRQRIRAVMSVSPNNPTGNILSQGELTALRNLELPLIVDEVFRPYMHASSTAYPPENSADPLRHASTSCLTIVLDGLSKRSCAPGLKLGWLIAQGKNASAFLKRLEWVSDTFLSLGGPVQYALGDIFAHEEQTQLQVQRRLKSNLACSHQILKDSALSALSPQGGWSQIIRLPQMMDEVHWWEALCQKGIWLQPGELYLLPLPCAFVVSLLTPCQEFEQGLLRLRALVDSKLSSNF